MTCHKCPHNAEIARLREICTQCKLGDGCPVSGTFSLDNMTDGALEDPRMRAKRAAGLESHAVFNPDTIDEPDATETPDQRERDSFIRLLADISQIPYSRLHDLTSLVRAFDGLTITEFQIVQFFLNGGTLAAYAKSYNLSKQTAHARCKALFRHKPVFKAIANGLLGKLKGGREKKLDTRQTYFDFGVSAEQAKQLKQTKQ